MYCKRAEVKSFRNIAEASLDFSEGVNVLVGENAQGKTNMLEAVFYASVGKSFRASAATEMIRFGDKYADISLDYRDKSRDNNLHFRIYGDKRRVAEKNHLRVEKLSDIVGSFRAVLFCPEHLSLIKDGPGERRSYLDIAISRISPKYIHSLQRYNYLLKQRNALLKSAQFDMKSFEATVELWSEQMAEEAAFISERRAEFVKRVSGCVEQCFCEMSGMREARDESAVVSYHSSSGLSEEACFSRNDVKNKYYSLLMSSHAREIAAGATLWGIHKDDVDIKLNGKSARIFASQGQQRSLALALKLAEGEICREEFGEYPVFLFDDVLSELDDTRRDYMILKCTDKQVIITTCEEGALQGMRADRKIRVRNGCYTVEG